MRVLFAARHVPGGALRFGGVQSWIETIARRLRSDLDAEVRVWEPGQPPPSGRFSIGFLAHAASTAPMPPLCGQALNICHGLVDDERPTAAGRTIYTAEELQEFWGRAGPVIRQPIDLDRWAPASGVRRDMMVFFSYRAPSCFGLDRLASRLKLKFMWLKDADKLTVRASLQRAALVCASGRAALEAMACGAPTLICDWRPYNNGPLAEMNLARAMRNNYSGRSGASAITAPLADYAADVMRHQQPREWISAHHDARLIAGQLMAAAC